MWEGITGNKEDGPTSLSKTDPGYVLFSGLSLMKLGIVS